MITPQDERSILARAYVPEHIVSLMVPVSKGEPFLIQDHLILAKDNWLILVGYPLDGLFIRDRCEKIVGQAIEQFRPEYLWFIGPEIPPSILGACQERESDQYYRLDLKQSKLKTSLVRVAEKASREVTIERSHSFSKDHRSLVVELLEREHLPPRIKELYRAMPDYVAHSSNSCVLNAWTNTGKLSAFYVLDLSADQFTTYLLGTHSKRRYVSHASDLLFLEMIKITEEQGKTIVNLGLGVNEGIRRFKEKWGGVAFLPYTFFTYQAPRWENLDGLLQKL